MTISMRNAQTANIAGCSISNLYVDDLLDEEIAQDLRHDGAADQIFAVRIFRHPLQIAGGHKEEGEHRDYRKQRQNGGGKASVGASRLDLSLEPEAFADHVGQARKYFTEIAARLLLQQHGRSK